MIAWALIAGFLLQPLLAYLVTPMFVHDSEGHQVIICTLKGKKLVDLDLPAPTNGDDTEHCPALKLFQMVSSAQVSAPPSHPPVTLYSVELLDQTATHQHHTLYFSAYSTRAPPVS